MRASDHVANINFEEFYAPAFPNAAAAQAFVKCVEGISTRQSKAKIVLHQAARMLWLADHIVPFARARPALLILFYVIAAEAVAKLVKGFQARVSQKDTSAFSSRTYAHGATVLSWPTLFGGARVGQPSQYAGRWTSFTTCVATWFMRANISCSRFLNRRTLPRSSPSTEGYRSS